MTMTIKAHFDGRAIIPDEPVELPLNEPLEVQIQTCEPGPVGTAAGLADSQLFGVWKDRTDITDTDAFARKLRKDGETRRHQIDDPAGQ
jgi:hypothetical protein